MSLSWSVDGHHTIDLVKQGGGVGGGGNNFFFLPPSVPSLEREREGGQEALKGCTLRVSMKGRERAIVNYTNVGTRFTNNVGGRLGWGGAGLLTERRVERIIMSFPSS